MFGTLEALGSAIKAESDIGGVSQGPVGNCAGMQLMLNKACGTKGMVTHSTSYTPLNHL
jgi:hypothetical protein